MIFNDPYCYPGTDILRNKPDIRDKERLWQFEFRKTAERSMELQESPVVGRFDLAHLQAIHSYLFQDLYAWAGKIRTVDIFKGSTFFAHHAAIQNYADKQVFPAIARDKLLVALDKPIFVKRLAYHFAEINALHPFREGNGRSTRQFVEQLARHAGFDLDYTKVAQNDWVDAAIARFSGNLVPMENVFTMITGKQ